MIYFSFQLNISQLIYYLFFLKYSNSISLWWILFKNSVSVTPFNKEKSMFSIQEIIAVNSVWT